MSKVQTYEVTAPDGKVLEVTGPAGASSDEVIRQAQALYKPSVAQPTAKGQPPDPRTATEVMQDQAANVIKGIPSAITAIPSTLATVGGMVKDEFTGNKLQALMKARQLASGMIAPLMSLGTAMGSGAPTGPNDEWAQAAQQAGSVGGSALLGAGMEYAPELSKPLQSQAVKQYTQALAPTTEKMKIRAARAVPEMLDQGITGNLESLQSQAAEQVKAIGKQREAAIQAAHQTLAQTQPVVDAIDKSLATRRIVIDNPATGQPEIMNQGVYDAAQKMKTAVQKFGADVPIDTLDKVKQYWQQVVDSAGGYERSGNPDIDLPKKIMRDAERGLAKEIQSKDPNIASIDAQYTIWRNMQQVVDKTILRKGPQGFPLRELATGLAGGTAAYLHSGGMAEAATGAAALGGLALAIKSPAWRTVSAVTKTQIAKLLANGTPEAMKAAALITTRLGSQLPQENVTDQKNGSENK